MFRGKIIIPVLAIIGGLIVTTSADAHPKGKIVAHPVHVIAAPVYVGHVYRSAPVVVVPAPVYQVVYRANCNQPWLAYQSYNSLAYAQDVANQLRAQGYETTIYQ